MCDACHQGVDVAVEPFQALHMAVDPVFRQSFAALGQVLEDLAEQGRVLLRHRRAEVRHLAHFPQELDPLGRMQT